MRQEIQRYIERDEWSAVVACLSPMEARMLISFAMKGRSLAAAAADLSLIDLNQGNKIALTLLQAGLIEVAEKTNTGNVYSVANRDLSGYCLVSDKKHYWKNIEEEVGSKIYSFVFAKFRAIEQLGFFNGDVHLVSSGAANAARAAIQKFEVK